MFAFTLTFAALAGLCLGGFAATGAIRLARGEQAVLGRSHCDACGAGLSVAQTAPLVSFVRAGGACHACGARIDPLHPIGELSGAAIVVVALLAAPLTRAPLIAAIGLVLLTSAAVDARTCRLPDLLTAATAVLGLALSLQRSVDAALIGLAAAAISFGVLEVVRRGFLALRGTPGLGFGDVKLIAALALWLGVTTPWAVALAALAGLMAARFVRSADGRLPFGPFIAAGAFVVGVAQEVFPWPT